jgi:hypothetical protein
MLQEAPAGQVFDFVIFEGIEKRSYSEGFVRRSLRSWRFCGSIIPGK